MDPPSSPRPGSASPGTEPSLPHAEVVPPPTLPYVEYTEDHPSGEADRLLPTASSSESASSNGSTGMLSRLTRALPSAPLLRCIRFEYPAFRWHRLGGVRLPEDEEAPAPEAAGQELKPPSRFAGCYASIKKRQFQLRWWHYLVILFVILAATVPPIVVAAVRRARRVRLSPYTS